MSSMNILNSLLGGALIGLAASLMMWTSGRVMGVSGILEGLMNFQSGDFFWRGSFLFGIILTSFYIPKLGFSIMEISFNRGIASAVVGGLLVGMGTKLARGCTSGHGVCGISRLSLRSLAATVTFMAFGMLVASWIGNVFGDVQ